MIFALMSENLRKNKEMKNDEYVYKCSQKKIRQIESNNEVKKPYFRKKREKNKLH